MSHKTPGAVTQTPFIERGYGESVKEFTVTTEIQLPNGVIKFPFFPLHKGIPKKAVTHEQQ
jgi:hypothetical protein